MPACKAQHPSKAQGKSNILARRVADQAMAAKLMILTDDISCGNSIQDKSVSIQSVLVLVLD